MTAAFGRTLHAQSQQQAAAPAPRPEPPELEEVHLTVNGQAHTLTLDPRTTLLDALREHLGLTGTKKGCDHGQCGACTVLVNGVRINSCLSLAVMHDGDEIVTIEGLADGRQLHPCSAPSSTATPSSAATARRARSARPSACWTKLQRGLPRPATADLAARPDRHRRRNPRAHERQHLPLLGLSEDRRRHPRRRGERAMRPFTYERAERRRRRGKAAASPAPRFLAGGTNLLDLMKLEIERPPHLIDVSRLPLATSTRRPTAACASAPWPPTPTSPPTPACARAIPVLAAGAALRRLAAVAQQGHDRRQSAAAHPLRLLLRHRQALQQARARRGCSAIGGFNRMHAILGASEACIAVHPSDMAVALTALDAEVEIAKPADATRRSPSTTCTGCLATPADRDQPRAGELITAVVLPPPPPGRQVYRKVRDRASYAFALVRVAALDVEGGRWRARWRWRRRAKPRRAGGRARAGGRGRGASSSPPPARRRFKVARRPADDNAFKIPGQALMSRTLGDHAAPAR